MTTNPHPTPKWTKHNDSSIAGGQPGFAFYTTTVNDTEWTASSDEQGGWFLSTETETHRFPTLRACKAHVAAW